MRRCARRRILWELCLFDMYLVNCACAIVRWVDTYVGMASWESGVWKPEGGGFC